MSDSIKSDIDDIWSDDIASEPKTEEEELPAEPLPATPSPSSKGGGALLDTSSFARRLAHGTPTGQDQEISRLSTHSYEDEMTDSVHSVDRAESEASFEQRPQDVNSNTSFDDGGKHTQEAVSTAGSSNAPEQNGSKSIAGTAATAVTMSESEVSGDVSTASSSKDMKVTNGKDQLPGEGAVTPYFTHPPAPPRPSLADRPKNNHTNNKNALDAIGEYMTFFFKKAEVYEEELEQRQSQRNLRGDNMDRRRHGSIRWNDNLPVSPEAGGSTSSDDASVDDKVKESTGGRDGAAGSPVLTASMGALAAVDAMSNFRSLTDSQRQVKRTHSMEMEKGQGPKKLKVDDEAKDEPMEVVEDESKKKEWKEQWDKFVQEKKKNKYNEIAIQSLALPVSVSEFCRDVIDDNATHSFGNFMRDIGELNVDTTPWSETQDANEPATRIVHYTHPVNAPMAPPTAKARKQQSLHTFGSAGMCLETCTVVEEVPMADCFVVDDRVWVSEAGEGSDGCIVAVTFQIRFIKSTFFRRIIESATRSEYESFWNQFADMIQTLKSPLVLEEEELEEVATELEEATAMLAAGEGQEVPLSSALNRIRSSSRRLSHVARLPSARKLSICEAEEQPEKGAQKVVTVALDGIASLRDWLSESENGFAMACAVFFFMFLLNILAVRQMMMMNGFLQNLDSRLEKMNELNEALLLKLSGGNVCEDESC